MTASTACACMSMKPGTKYLPDALIVWAEPLVTMRPAVITLILPFSITTFRCGVSAPVAVSTTVTFASTIPESTVAPVCAGMAWLNTSMGVQDDCVEKRLLQTYGALHTVFLLPVSL